MRLYLGFKFINTWEHASAWGGGDFLSAARGQPRCVQVKGEQSSGSGRPGSVYPASLHPSPLPGRGQRLGEVSDGPREASEVPFPITESDRRPLPGTGVSEPPPLPRSWPGSFLFWSGGCAAVGAARLQQPCGELCTLLGWALHAAGPAGQLLSGRRLSWGMISNSGARGWGGAGGMGGWGWGRCGGASALTCLPLLYLGTCIF